MLAAVLALALALMREEILGDKRERERKGNRRRRRHGDVVRMCSCWCDRVAFPGCKVDGGGGARARTGTIGSGAKWIARRRDGNGKFGLDGFLVTERDELRDRVVGRGRRNVPRWERHGH